MRTVEVGWIQCARFADLSYIFFVRCNDESNYVLCTKRFEQINLMRNESEINKPLVLDLCLYQRIKQHRQTEVNFVSTFKKSKLENL